MRLTGRRSCPRGPHRAGRNQDGPDPGVVNPEITVIWGCAAPPNCSSRPSGRPLKTRTWSPVTFSTPLGGVFPPSHPPVGPRTGVEPPTAASRSSTSPPGAPNPPPTRPRVALNASRDTCADPISALLGPQDPSPPLPALLSPPGGALRTPVSPWGPQTGPRGGPPGRRAPPR